MAEELAQSTAEGPAPSSAQDPTRIIYYGDNLDILRRHIAPESVGLAYLDPPFKSQRDYNLLFRNVKGDPAEAQVRAFTDTWKWTPGVRATCDWLLEDPTVPGKVSEMIRAFHSFMRHLDEMPGTLPLFGQWI